METTENPQVFQDEMIFAEETHSKVCYCRTQMQKELVIEKLKQKGYRMTKKRQLLVEIILEDANLSCKEIHDKAIQKDSKIGIATVYRMLNLLEEIGALSRKRINHVVCDKTPKCELMYEITLDDHTTLRLPKTIWQEVIKSGLAALGYLSKQKVNYMKVEKYEVNNL